MKQIVTFLLLILFPGALLHAATISGVVVDDEGEPLEFANVTLLNDSSYVAGVITDESGRFEMERPALEVNKYKVSMIGYDDVMSALPASGEIGTIRLSASTGIALKEVTVKAAKPVTKLTESGLVTSVANTNLATAGTAGDVLGKLPLVNVENDEVKVFGRGVPKIYINGRPITDTNELQQLSSGDIKSVEVITVPGVKYSSSVNSVINIKTLPPKGDGFSASLYSANYFWQRLATKESASFKYRHNGLETFIEGSFFDRNSRYYNDCYLGATGTTNLESYYYPVMYAKRHSLTGKVGFNYQLDENNSFGAYYSMGRSKSSNRNIALSKYHFKDNPWETSVTEESGKVVSGPTQSANIYYIGLIKGLEIELNADFVKQKSDNEGSSVEYFNHERNDIRMNSHTGNDAIMWAEKLDLAYPLWKGKISAGNDFTRTTTRYYNKYTGIELKGGDSKIAETNLGFYAQLAQLFGQTNVALGVRAEFSSTKYYSNGEYVKDKSQSGSSFFPMLTVTSQINQVNLLFKLTHQTERPEYECLDANVHYLNRYEYKSGNPFLKSAKATTADAMAKWRTFFAQLIFVHEVNPVIFVSVPYAEDPNITLSTFLNMPKVQKLTFNVGANPKYGCWESNVTAGMQANFFSVPYMGRMKKCNTPAYNLKINNEFSLPKDWSLSADFYGVTSGYLLSPHTYMLGYSQVNLGVKKLFFNKSLVAQVMVNDLFAKTSFRNTFYYGDYIHKSYNYDEYRNVTLSLRYNFNVTDSRYKGTGAGEDEKKRL